MLLDSAIPSGDITKLESNGHVIKDRILNIVPKVEIATATIDGTPTSYPLADLTVTGATGWDDIQAGMMVFIGSSVGAYDIAVSLIRKLPDNTTTLNINPIFKGDSASPFGRAGLHGTVQDGHYVTVIKFYPLITEFSRIADETFYKRWDLEHDWRSNPLEFDLLPVANAGKWRSGFVNERTGLLSVTFDGSNSFAWYGTSAKSNGLFDVASYQWNFDGGIITNGNENSESPTVDFQEGFYVVTLIVEDTRGGEHVGRTLVWANTRTGENAPFSVRNAGIQLGGIRSSRIGSEMNISVAGQSARDELFPFCAFHYSETPKYNGQEIETENAVFDNAAFYIKSLQTPDTSATPENVIVLEGVANRIKQLPNSRQYINQNDTPYDWTYVTISTPATALWYLLHWHLRNALVLHDFIIGGTFKYWQKKTFVFDSEGFGNQIGQLETWGLANFGSTTEGAILFCPKPQYRESNYISVLPAKWTFEPKHYTSPINATRKLYNAVGEVMGYAFAWRAANTAYPVGSRTSLLQGQGARFTMPNFIVPYVGAQSHCNRIIGAKYAELNAEYNAIKYIMTGNLDIFEPCDLRTFIRDSRYIRPDNTNGYLMPLSVNRAYKTQNGSILKTITVEFELLAQGNDGVAIEIERGGAANNTNDSGWNDYTSGDYETTPQDPDNTIWKNTDSDVEKAYMLAFNDLGALAYCEDVSTRDRRWKSCKGTISGVVKGIQWTTQDYEVLVLSWNQSTQTAYIYSSSPTSARPSSSTSWTLLDSWQITATGFEGNIILAGQEGGIYAAVYNTDSGVNVRYSYDYFATSYQDVIGSDPADNSNVNREIGAFADALRIYSGGATGTAEYGAYHTLLSPYTETLISNLPTYSDFAPAVAIAKTSAGKLFSFPQSIAAPFEQIYFSDLPAPTTLATTITIDAVSYPLVESSTDPAAIGTSACIGFYKRWDLGANYSLSGIKAKTRFTLRFPSGSESDNFNNGGVWQSTGDPLDDGSLFPIGQYNPTCYVIAEFYNSSMGLLYTHDYLNSQEILGGSFYWDTPLITVPVFDEHLHKYESFFAEFHSGYRSNWEFSQINGVRYVAIKAYCDPRNWGAGEWTQIGGGNPTYTRFDIDFIQSTFSYLRSQLQEVIPYRLYKLTNEFTTPAWTEVTPSNSAPLRQIGLHVDPSDNSNVVAAMVGDGARGVWYSNDGGNNWSTVTGADNKYNGAKRYGNGLILFGNGKLDITNDLTGQTAISVLANWVNSVGAVGNIEGVLIDYDR